MTHPIRKFWTAMRILQHNSAQLIIQERLIGIWLLSIGITLVGLFMFFLFEPPVDWIGAVCIALGGIFATLTPTETFVFDRARGHLTIHRQHLLKKQTAHYPMAAVVDVQVKNVEFLGTRFHRVVLHLEHRQWIAVTQTISTDWKQQQSVLRHIRGFLKTG